VVPQLDRVGAVMVLVEDLLHDRVAEVAVAGAVEAEHNLVAAVDRAELRRRAEDVQEMRDLVGAERRHLCPAHSGLDALVKIRLDLGLRHQSARAVAETRRKALCHDSLRLLSHITNPRPR